MISSVKDGMNVLPLMKPLRVINMADLSLAPFTEGSFIFAHR